MEKELQQQLLIMIEELIAEIKGDSLYKKYILLSEKMKNHLDIPIMIDNIRKLQKCAVKEESFHNYEKVAELNMQIENNFSLLREIPLYLDFIEVQGELDEVFQFIREQLQKIIFS